MQALRHEWTTDTGDVISAHVDTSKGRKSWTTNDGKSSTALDWWRVDVLTQDGKQAGDWALGTKDDAYNVGCGMLRALHAGYPVPLWEVPVPGRAT